LEPLGIKGGYRNPLYNKLVRRNGLSREVGIAECLRAVRAN
jgi:hypothetical protein